MLTGERHELILDRVKADGRVSAATLAEDFGVSEITIRRDLNALHGKGLLRRIHGGALPAGAGPRTGSVRLTVGVVVPVSNYYYADVINGAMSVADGLDTRLILGVSGYAHHDNNPVQRILEKGINGLLVSTPMGDGEPEGVADWLGELPIPTVLMERSFGFPTISREVDIVRSDHAHGALLALRHLRALGHNSIAVALSPTPTAHWLRKGVISAAEELELAKGLQVSSLPPDYDPQSYPALVQLLSESLKRGTKAFFVHNDIQASQLVDIALQQGLAIPSDIAVVTYDDVVASLAPVPLTAVAPPKRSIGAISLELLVRRLRQPAGRIEPTMHMSLLPTLIVRASTGG